MMHLLILLLPTVFISVNLTHAKTQHIHDSMVYESKKLNELFDLRKTGENDDPQEIIEEPSSN